MRLQNRLKKKRFLIPLCSSEDAGKLVAAAVDIWPHPRSRGGWTSPFLHRRKKATLVDEGFFPRRNIVHLSPHPGRRRHLGPMFVHRGAPWACGWNRRSPPTTKLRWLSRPAGWVHEPHLPCSPLDLTTPWSPLETHSPPGPWPSSQWWPQIPISNLSHGRRQGTIAGEEIMPGETSGVVGEGGGHLKTPEHSRRWRRRW